MTTGTPAKNFGFGEDEEMLRDVARKYLDENLPVQKLRTLVAEDSDAVYERGEPTRWDEGLWKEIVELGWTGLAVPESAGGMGFSVAGIAGLVEEVGRHAVPSPLIATLNATYVLASAKTENANSFLSEIADGASATLAVTDAKGSWNAEACDVSAQDGGEVTRLSGSAAFVQDAAKTNLFVVQARKNDGTVLCVVRTEAAGVEIKRDHIHDLTRDQATVTFEDVEVASSDIVSEDGAAAIEAAWPSILVTVAADLCGCGEWQLQTTVEYAKQRKQFERQLGFFQAVKHPLVNAMMAIDRARSLVYHAASCIDVGSDERRPYGEECRLGRRGIHFGSFGTTPRRNRIHLGMRHPPLLQTQHAQPISLWGRHLPAPPPRE